MSFTAHSRWSLKRATRQCILDRRPVLACAQRVLNAQMHPIVRTFLNLGNERIAKRYCHLHPEAVPKHVHEALQKARKHIS